MKVLVNGRLIGRSEASIDLEDRGYQFGDGIYEVIRVYKGVLFGLREHAERFFRSAAEIGISLPFSIEDLEWDLQKLAWRRPLCDGWKGSDRSGEQPSWRIDSRRRRYDRRADIKRKHRY